MTCDMALEAISAALDGGLSDAERAELEAHLAICPACRALCEDLKAIREDVLDSELEVPAGFHDKVMAAVAEEPSLTPVKRKKAALEGLGQSGGGGRDRCAGGWSRSAARHGRVRWGGCSGCGQQYGRELPAGSCGSGRGRVL